MMPALMIALALTMFAPAPALRGPNLIYVETVRLAPSHPSTGRSHASRNVVAWRTAHVSWYETGRVTANGERFRPDGLTCAHKTLKFGTRVTFRYRGREVTCRVNDRGPYVAGRAFDLSQGAARQLGLIDVGAATVEYKIGR